MGERCLGFVGCFDFVDFVVSCFVDFVVFALLARKDFVKWDFVGFALPFSFSLRDFFVRCEM